MAGRDAEEVPVLTSSRIQSEWGVEVKKQKDYAVYKGDELLVIGTKEECAATLGVKPETISWMASPAAKRRLAERGDPDDAMTAIVIEDDDEEETA